MALSIVNPLILVLIVLCFLNHGFVYYSSSTSSNTSDTHHHRCPSDQSLALLGFRKALNTTEDCLNNDEARNLPWDNSSDCCAWDGIECDEFTGNVVSLIFSGSCLEGTIGSNSTLFHLTHLRSLALTGCDNLSGEIANSIGNLKFLRYLHLSRCSFSGSIPESIGSLSQLTFLDLSHNYFTGVFPSLAANMSQLERLDFSNNRMSGMIPFNIIGFPKLNHLDLSNNLFRGKLPPWLFAQPSLQVLNLRSNQLEGQLPEFRSNSLVFIDLANNTLSGPIPRSISKLLNLSTLRLPLNRLSGNLDIGMFSELQLLYFIDLSHNLLEGPVPFPSRSTRTHCISYNKFNGEIPSSFCNSSTKVLDLSHNNLSGEIPECFGTLKDLVVLDLSKNRLVGTIPPLEEVFSLNILNLNGNQLEGRIPLSLAKCAMLQIVDLGNNMLRGSFPHWLQGLPSLEVLILRSNKFYGPLRQASFLDLLILDIADNEFTGNLPSMLFENLEEMIQNDHEVPHKRPAPSSDLIPYHDYYKALVSDSFQGDISSLLRQFFSIVDLSSNKFEGQIPNSIGSLGSLGILNLSHNGFTGQIPPLIGNISELESLDLSSNKLVGEIPQELVSLTFLAILNLAHNHLSGCIPQSGQFETFGNDSYLGNSDLRGVPLSKDCMHNQSRPPLLLDQEPENDSTFAEGFTWKVVAMGYGSGTVLGVIIGYVMTFTRKPRWFFRAVDAEEERIVKWKKKKIHIDMWKMNMQSRTRV